MKGKKPKIRLIFLYLPVRCIIHLRMVSEWKTHEPRQPSYPANMDPRDIETLLGRRCSPDRKISNPQQMMMAKTVPASDALVKGTVWNHMGKKYMIAKLQLATRKLLMPTKTGIFCFSKKGASMGSLATRSSKTTNVANRTKAKTKGTMTDASLHYTNIRSCVHKSRRTYLVFLIITVTQE